ncbi:hypothetical protein GCM10010232_19980 [Streptomyces amakusaensis]
MTEALAEWDLTDRRDGIRLCVSELATNAPLHGVPSGREFAVSLLVDGGLLRLEVRYSGGGWPQVRNPSDGEAAGRGLHLVRESADDFGVVCHTVGKAVWCAFKTELGPEAKRWRNPRSQRDRPRPDRGAGDRWASGRTRYAFAGHSRPRAGSRTGILGSWWGRAAYQA